MSRIVVLDAGPLIDLVKGEPSGVIVQQFLDDDNCLCFAHVMNLMEVFYDLSRLNDVLAARAVLNDLFAAGVGRDTTFDVDFAEDAAQLKAQWKRVSLADCCGLALARRLKAQFVTTDRHELEALSAAGVADICFTR